MCLLFAAAHRRRRPARPAGSGQAADRSGASLRNEPTTCSQVRQRVAAVVGDRGERLLGCRRLDAAGGRSRPAAGHATQADRCSRSSRPSAIWARSACDRKLGRELRVAAICGSARGPEGWCRLAARIVRQPNQKPIAIGAIITNAELKSMCASTRPIAQMPMITNATPSPRCRPELEGRSRRRSRTRPEA